MVKKNDPSVTIKFIDSTTIRFTKINKETGKEESEDKTVELLGGNGSDFILGLEEIPTRIVLTRDYLTFGLHLQNETIEFTRPPFKWNAIERSKISDRIKELQKKDVIEYVVDKINDLVNEQIRIHGLPDNGATRDEQTNFLDRLNKLERDLSKSPYLLFYFFLLFNFS